MRAVTPPYIRPWVLPKMRVWILITAILLKPLKVNLECKFWTLLPNRAVSITHTPEMGFPLFFFCRLPLLTRRVGSGAAPVPGTPFCPCSFWSVQCMGLVLAMKET